MSRFLITIVPNYAAVERNEKLYLEISQPMVLEPLIAQGFDVSLAAPSNVAPDAYRNGALAMLTLPEIIYYRLGAVNSQNGVFSRAVSYFRQILPIVTSIRNTDFAYIYFPGHTPILSVIACLALRKPYALYIRCDLKLVPKTLQPLLPLIFRKAAFLIVTGEKLAERLSRKGYRSRSVVPLSPLLWREDLHHQATPVGKSISLLFVGQMVREKGIFELVDAFSQLRKIDNTFLCLNMVGVGEDLTSLREHARQLGVDESIRFHGLVAEPTALARVFRDSSVFVLPTYYPEGFPRVLWEAMAFELPIITTPVGQIATELLDGINVVFCEPRSVKSLSDALLKVIKNAELRNRLAEAGRSHWLNRKMKYAAEKSHGDQVVKELKSLGFIPDNKITAGI